MPTSYQIPAAGTLGPWQAFAEDFPLVGAQVVAPIRVGSTAAPRNMGTPR